MEVGKEWTARGGLKISCSQSRALLLVQLHAGLFSRAARKAKLRSATGLSGFSMGIVSFSFRFIFLDHAKKQFKPGAAIASRRLK
jgi:hypothetical protein